MKKIFLSRIVAALALVCSPLALLAQQPACSSQAEMSNKLLKDYGETLQVRGLIDQNAMFELYASNETGTWTVVRIGLDGTSCIIGAGTHVRLLMSQPHNRDPAA